MSNYTFIKRANEADTIIDTIRASTADPQTLAYLKERQNSKAFNILGSILGMGAGGVLGGVGTTFLTDNKDAILPGVGVGAAAGGVLGNLLGSKLDKFTNNLAYPIDAEILYISDKNLNKRLKLIDEAIAANDLDEEQKEKLIEFKNKALKEKEHRKIYGIY